MTDSSALFREENPDIRCVLVTSDLPLTVKAHHYQIELIEPTEALLLPPEPDAAEKKIKQLEADLQLYKSRMPMLDLRFEDGGQHATFQITRPSGIRRKKYNLYSRQQSKDIL
jgi:hypothetical protein